MFVKNNLEGNGQRHSSAGMSPLTGTSTVSDYVMERWERQSLCPAQPPKATVMSGPAAQGHVWVHSPAAAGVSGDVCGLNYHMWMSVIWAAT